MSQLFGFLKSFVKHRRLMANNSIGRFRMRIQWPIAVIDYLTSNKTIWWLFLL